MLPEMGGRTGAMAAALLSSEHAVDVD